MIDLQHKMRKAAGRPCLNERKNYPKKAILKRLDLLEDNPLFQNQLEEIGDLRRRLLAIKPKRCAIRETSIPRVVGYAMVRPDPRFERIFLDLHPEFLKKMIAAHPNWQHTETYIDFGGFPESGTPCYAFDRMMQDAEDGKFDMVFTRSMEFLAPDFTSGMKVIEKLRKLGISVYLADEQINSMEPDGEIALSVLALFEQKALQMNCKDLQENMMVR